MNADTTLRLPLLAALNGDRVHPAAPRTPAWAREQVLDAGSVAIVRIYHGEGIASWAVNRYGISRDCGIRTGLEDCPVLPDGRTASGNGEVVAAAAALLRLSA